ncbi:MAG TPA: hypothetical protein VF422_04640, partial [Dokdonella sp.]
MHRLLRCLLSSIAVATGSAWAEPAHYLVLEYADGDVVPVYYRQVELAADPRTSLRLPASGPAADRIRWRGRDGRVHEVSMPAVVRAEFARDPESATSTIESVVLPDHPRSFVVRVPLAEGDHIDLELPGGATRRLDLG